MPSILRLSQAPRFPFVAAFIVACALFGGAVYLGNALRLAACPLCIVQRMACLALAASAGLGIVLGGQRWGRVGAALLMLASTGSGAFVAGYQTYIQRVATDVQCSGEAAWWELFVDWAGEKAPLLFHANGLCSDPAWKLFGLSLAEYALLGFCALTVLGLLALWRR